MMDKQAQEDIEKIGHAVNVIVGNDEEEKHSTELHTEEGRRRFRARIVRQFLLTLFFGFTGIPMLWRTRKHYGVFLLVLFIVSTVLTVVWGFWYLFILVGFLWLVDFVACTGRIRYYVLGRRTHRRTLAREMNEKTDNAPSAEHAEQKDED